MQTETEGVNLMPSRKTQLNKSAASDIAACVRGEFLWLKSKPRPIYLRLSRKTLARTPLMSKAYWRVGAEIQRKSMNHGEHTLKSLSVTAQSLTAQKQLHSLTAPRPKLMAIRAEPARHLQRLPRSNQRPHLKLEPQLLRFVAPR
jgi:hypothetical protein